MSDRILHKHEEYINVRERYGNGKDETERERDVTSKTGEADKNEMKASVEG